MKIIKHTDMYFKIGGTFYKITKQKHPTLYGFLVLKRKTIVDDYNLWLKDQKEDGVNEIVFPRLAVDEKFFDRLKQETNVKIRCVEIFYDVPNKDNRLVNIMGIGFYNDLIHQQLIENNPALATLQTPKNATTDSSPLTKVEPTEPSETQNS